MKTSPGRTTISLKEINSVLSLLSPGLAYEARLHLQSQLNVPLTPRPLSITVPSIDSQFLERLRDAVEKHLSSTNFNVEWLADEVAMSSRQLQRRLRALTGLSAAGYIREMRLQRAKQFVEQRAGTVAEIAYMTGFNDVRHFSQLFGKRFGHRPSSYLKRTTIQQQSMRWPSATT